MHTGGNEPASSPRAWAAASVHTGARELKRGLGVEGMREGRRKKDLQMYETTCTVLPFLRMMPAGVQRVGAVRWQRRKATRKSYCTRKPTAFEKKFFENSSRRKKGDRVNTCVDTPHTCADVSSTYRSVAYLARDRVFSVASILAPQEEVEETVHHVKSVEAKGATGYQPEEGVKGACSTSTMCSPSSGGQHWHL